MLGGSELCEPHPTPMFSLLLSCLLKLLICVPSLTPTQHHAAFHSVVWRPHRGGRCGSVSWVSPDGVWGTSVDLMKRVMRRYYLGAKEIWYPQQCGAERKYYHTGWIIPRPIGLYAKTNILQQKKSTEVVLRRSWVIH